MVDNTWIMPSDPAKVKGVHDGTRWIYNLRPGTLRINQASGSVTFDVMWNGRVRRFTLALENVAGYEESA